MKWFNIVGGVTTVLIAPTVTIIGVVTSSDYRGLSRLNRTQLLTLTPSVAVLIVGATCLVFALVRRDRSRKFKKPRSWGKLSSFPGAHAAAVRFGMSFTQRNAAHKASIMSFMIEFLAEASEATIFTRDMSWISNDRAYEALKRLAKARHLTIYLHAGTGTEPRPLSVRLSKLDRMGATVLQYQHPGHPSVRFTRIKASGTTKLAIARDTPRVHKIQELHNESDVAFQMANCLTSIESVARTNGA